MKHDCWSKAKLSHQNEVYLHYENYTYEDEMFDEVITRVLRMKDSNFLKEFMLRMLQNNVFLNARMCKWAEDKNELCSNYGLWPETRIHFFLSCPKTNEIINFMEKIL